MIRMNFLPHRICVGCLCENFQLYSPARKQIAEQEVAPSRRLFSSAAVRGSSAAAADFKP